MINNFSYFLYENNLTDYLNCYSTFLMTRKDLKNNILNHRMNFLINYYIQEKNSKMKKYKLIEYYIRSYKDDYLKKTIEYNNENDNNGNENAIDENENENDNENDNENPIDEYEIERRDEDVEDHYKYMFINPPRKAEIDYDDIDRIYELKLEEEERLKDREKEILLENEYEDNYDNYDINENYEDYEYNTDDDYYEINEEYY